ncbi:hypothetical protein FA13DRAFT_1784520 [Coprinellus micaceus]|uniref:Uncharacterized protein n=1 Tax=Coprinellus micaceus TaxID=71717 RepID=A0A4Y7U1E4_COPMI|nr:hypothetical protein FA13DRAFT_1784520 [Coprinellus micaceus]
MAPDKPPRHVAKGKEPQPHQTARTSAPTKIRKAGSNTPEPRQEASSTAGSIMLIGNPPQKSMAGDRSPLLQKRKAGLKAGSTELISNPPKKLKAGDKNAPTTVPSAPPQKRKVGPKAGSTKLIANPPKKLKAGDENAPTTTSSAPPRKRKVGLTEPIGSLSKKLKAGDENVLLPKKKAGSRASESRHVASSPKGKSVGHETNETDGEDGEDGEASEWEPNGDDKSGDEDEDDLDEDRFLERDAEDIGIPSAIAPTPPRNSNDPNSHWKTPIGVGLYLPYLLDMQRQFATLHGNPGGEIRDTVVNRQCYTVDQEPIFFKQVISFSCKKPSWKKLEKLGRHIVTGISAVKNALYGRAVDAGGVKYKYKVFFDTTPDVTDCLDDRAMLWGKQRVDLGIRTRTKSLASGAALTMQTMDGRIQGEQGKSTSGQPGHQSSWEALRAKHQSPSDPVPPWDALGCPGTGMLWLLWLLWGAQGYSGVLTGQQGFDIISSQVIILFCNYCSVH